MKDMKKKNIYESPLLRYCSLENEAAFLSVSNPLEVDRTVSMFGDAETGDPNGDIIFE